MSKLGSKKMTEALKKDLRRNSKRETRTRDTSGTILEKYNVLVESFTKADYLRYEQLHHKWGTPGRKRQVMLDVVVKENIEGPVRHLTEVRVNDLAEHQKILQVLRYRWLNKEEHYKKQVNSDPEKFWEAKARSIVRNNKERKIHVSAKWTGEENLPEVISFLKKLYEKQKGKCAISGVPLELQVGTGKPNPNKCSLDRINSDNGYTPQNVWLVAWWVNAMKSDMTMETFKERIKILYEAGNEQ